jgi:hypothetical protein
VASGLDDETFDRLAREYEQLFLGQSRLDRQLREAREASERAQLRLSFLERILFCDLLARHRREIAQKLPAPSETA